MNTESPTRVDEELTDYHFSIYRVIRFSHSLQLQIDYIGREYSFDECIENVKQCRKKLVWNEYTLMFLFIEFSDRQEKKYLGVYSYDPVYSASAISDRRKNLSE